MPKFKRDQVVKVHTSESSSIYVRRFHGGTGVVETYQMHKQRYTVRVTNDKGFTGWFSLPEEWLSPQV